MYRVACALLFSSMLCCGCGFTNEPDPGVSSPFDMGFSMADEVGSGTSADQETAIAMNEPAPMGVGDDFIDPAAPSGQASMGDGGVGQADGQADTAAEEGPAAPGQGEAEEPPNEPMTPSEAGGEPDGETDAAGGADESSAGGEEAAGGTDGEEPAEENGGADASGEVGERCMDLGRDFFGACSQVEQPGLLGYGVVAGACRPISGCGPAEVPLFDTAEECEAECGDDLGPPEDQGCICPLNYAPVCGDDGRTYSNRCAAACEGITETTPGECEQAACIDLEDHDFGNCRAILGAGVVGGVCQTISGCSAGDVMLFPDVVACERACRTP